MNCFKNYIGIKGCNGYDNPDSGLFINSLPGLTMKSMDNIANSEQVNYLGVFDECEDRAIERLRVAIIDKFKARWKIKSITQSVNLGRRITTTTSAAFAGYRGFSVDLLYPLIDFQRKLPLRSSLQIIRVQSLNLYLESNPNADINIKIIDAETLEELFTTILKAYDPSDNTTGREGWNLIKVNEKFAANKIWCLYDSSNDNATELRVPFEALTSWRTMCADIYGSGVQAWIRGVQCSSTYTGQVLPENTFGLSGIFSIGCEFDSYVCDNKSLFAAPLQWAIGSEIMVEQLYNRERFNYLTTVAVEDAEKLKALYDSKFEDTMVGVIDGIHFTQDCCLICNYPFQIKESEM